MNAFVLKNLQGITAASLEHYLSLTGWKRDDALSDNKKIIFYEIEDPEFCIAIPANENNRDYYVDLYKIIKMLSDYQERNIEEVINLIKSSYTDRIQFRIVSDMSIDGKVSLGYAAECIEGLRDLILYASSAEEKVQPICARAANSAKNYLNQFKFGQTEIGSFIFNIDVQVIEEENEQMYFDEVSPPEPIAHKVVRRIETAMDQVDKVATGQMAVGEVVREAYKNGVTANICDALTKLKPRSSSEATVETTFFYAGALTRSIEQPHKKILGEVHFLCADAIAKKYREQIFEEDVVLTGIIKMLSKETNSDGDGADNTVRLLARVDNKMRSIKLHLSSEDHKRACNAYRDDKEVQVAGTLDKSQKYWSFTNIQQFTVLD